MMVTFDVQKICSFVTSHQLVFLSNYVICILSRKSFPIPISLRIFTTLSSMRFMGCGLMCRSVINLELSFLKGYTFRSFCIFLHETIPFDQHHLLKMQMFYSVYFWLLYQKLSTHKFLD